jgi:hypothetical protein
MHYLVSAKEVKRLATTFLTFGCTIAKRGWRDLRVSIVTVFSSYFKAKYLVLI